MAYYEWSCCVEGKDNGVVKANSVKNALKKAKIEIEDTDMTVVGEIDIVRVSKKDEQYYKNCE